MATHRNSTIPDIPFKAMIVRRIDDHVDRKLAEAIHTGETSPPINTDRSWRLLPTVRKRSLDKCTHEQKLKHIIISAFLISVSVEFVLFCT